MNRLVFWVSSILALSLVVYGCNGGSFSFELNINNVDPDNGSVAGGTVVVLTIKANDADETNTTVTFGGNLATVNQVDDLGGNEFEVTVATPASAVADTVDVTLQVRNQQKTLQNAFTYSPSLLFVANAGNQSVAVFDNSADSTATPLRTFSLATPPISLFVSGKEVFVGASEQISVYPTPLDSSLPLRNIRGIAAQIRLPRLYVTRDEIFVASASDDGSGLDAISVLAKSATGEVVPQRQIILQNASMPSGIFVAEAEIFVCLAAQRCIAVYNSQADGAVAPVRVVSGENTRLLEPSGIFVDSIHREIFVVDRPSNSVIVFDYQADGNANPKRILAGENTRMASPCAVFVDPGNYLLYVANKDSDSVNIYRRDAMGNSEPQKILAGLDDPQAIFISDVLAK